jgi:hypothetical protein
MAASGSAASLAPPRARTVLALAIFVIAVNIFDAFVTIQAVRYGHDVEANPLMRLAIVWGAETFLVIKTVSVTALAVGVASSARRQRIAWYGLVLLSAIFFALLVYQAYILGHLHASP